VFPPPAPDASRLRPGVVVQVSGIYRVHHYAHRMPHNVIIEAGLRLPRCRRCGDAVRFAPLITAEVIENDIDFQEELSSAV
jgi:hypothetical protein